MVVLKQKALLEVVNSGLNPYLDQVTAQDLQLIYQNKDGTFGVTNAALADAKMGQKRQTATTTTTTTKPDTTKPPDASSSGTTEPPAQGDDTTAPPPGVPVDPAPSNDSGLIIETDVQETEGNADG